MYVTFPLYNNRWFRRDRESSDSLVPLEASYGSHLLNIHRASVSDSGIYVCIAANPFGEIRNDFAIQVTSPLSLHVSPQVRACQMTF